MKEGDQLLLDPLSTPLVRGFLGALQITMMNLLLQIRVGDVGVAPRCKFEQPIAAVEGRQPGN